MWNHSRNDITGGSRLTRRVENVWKIQKNVSLKPLWINDGRWRWRPRIQIATHTAEDDLSLSRSDFLQDATQIFEEDCCTLVARFCWLVCFKSGNIMSRLKRVDGRLQQIGDNLHVDERCMQRVANRLAKKMYFWQLKSAGIYFLLHWFGRRNCSMKRIVNTYWCFRIC